MAINDVYRMVKYPSVPLVGASFKFWRSFYESILPGERLVPDGYVEFLTSTAVIALFLEVDLGNESLKVWTRKAKAYFQFAISGEFEKRSGHKRFRVLVVVNSERRLRSLREATAAVTDRVFRFATLDMVKRDGILGPIWRNPVGIDRLPLIGQSS